MRSAISILILLLVNMITLSCGHGKSNHEAINENGFVQIDINSSSEYHSLATNINISAVVNLETNDSSIISGDDGVRKILVRDSKIIVLDGKYMAIKVYDLQGKYLFDVGRLGVGLGQFTNVQDIGYNEVNNSLWVLCNTPRKVIEFSMLGKLIREHSISFFASGFAFEDINSDQNIYYYVNQNDNFFSKKKNIIITDSANKIKGRMFDFPKDVSASIMYTGGIYNPSKGEVFFNPAFSRVYYSLSKEKADAAYKVNFGERDLPEDSIKTIHSFKDLIKKHSMLLSTFVKTKRYVGFNCFDSKVNTVFYNYHTKHIIANDSSLDSLNRLFYNSIYQSGEEIIMVLNTNSLSSFIKRNSKMIEQKFPLLYDKIVNKNEQDNPSLIFFNLKDI